MKKLIYKYISFLSILISSLIFLAKYKEGERKEYLSSVSFDISLMISQDSGVSERVIKYIDSLDDIHIRYNKEQTIYKGLIFEFELYTFYINFKNNKKEVSITKTSLIGAYS